MLSISIITRNEEANIERCLESVKWADEIIIVDSGSTDKTLDICPQFPVKILPIKSKDFSFGRALNIGCRAASNEIIVFASAHVYPIYNDWLEKMINPFKKKEVGLVYGKQRGNEFTKYSEQQIFKKWFPNSDQTIGNNIFCNNANASIRKSIWAEIPYDEELTGLEDLDWAKKITRKGFEIIYEKDAVRCIFHLLESTNKSGLYNIGTGQAQSFKDLANALLINLKEPESLIKYVDMPKDLENKYQYYTEADIKQLRNSGYDLKFNNLLEGVSDYVQNYLLQPDQYA